MSERDEQQNPRQVTREHSSYESQHDTHHASVAAGCSWE
jgi:hypothetical protein